LLSHEINCFLYDWTIFRTHTISATTVETLYCDPVILTLYFDKTPAQSSAPRTPQPHAHHLSDEQNQRILRDSSDRIQGIHQILERVWVFYFSPLFPYLSTSARTIILTSSSNEVSGSHPSAPYAFDASPRSSGTSAGLINPPNISLLDA
jgi:hypothetical protein